jgi:hypothetical protein
MRRIDKSRMRVLIFCHQQAATSDLDALKYQSELETLCAGEYAG